MAEQVIDAGGAPQASPATVAATAPGAGPRPGVVQPATRGHHKLSHIPALDGLRGVAVAGVLLYHGGHLKGGYLGVDLFFVLSGYLITSLLLTEWKNSTGIRLGNFWARRARRLFPALVVVLLVVCAYAHWVATPVDLGQIRSDGFATLFYVANWHSILAGHNYFQASLAPSPLEHTWSLAIEEQFYVIWPLVVFGLLRWRSRPGTVLRASVAIAGLSASLMIGLHLSGVVSDNSLYLGTHTRVAAIAMGAALAAWHVQRGHTQRPSQRVTLEVLTMGAGIFLALMWSHTDLQTGFVYSGGLALCGLAVTVVIATATHPEPIAITRVLSFAPFRWLGLISYGLYLWHWPIYLYLNENRTHLHGWALLGIQAFVAIDVATLSYFLLERPIRYGALRGAWAMTALPVGAGLITVALLASTVGAAAPEGNDSALPSAPRQAPGAALPIRARAPGAPTLMIAGDSVALFLATEGIVPIRDQLGVSVVNQAQIGCSPMLSVGKMNDPNGRPHGPPLYSDCSTPWQRSVDRVRPQAVILMLGAQPVSSVEIDGRSRTACDSQYKLAFTHRVTRLVDVLSSRGAHVAIATVVPLNSASLAQLPEDTTRRVECVNQVLIDVGRHHAHASVVDIASFVCPSACRNKVGRVELRPGSGTHFRGAGAQYVARWVVPQVLAASRAG